MDYDLFYNAVQIHLVSSCTFGVIGGELAVIFCSSSNVYLYLYRFRDITSTVQPLEYTKLACNAAWNAPIDSECHDFQRSNKSR
jgi:hypothetical protein